MRRRPTQTPRTAFPILKHWCTGVLLIRTLDWRGRVYLAQLYD